MDRAVLEGDPRVIEGMLIAAYAIGSDEAWLRSRPSIPNASPGWKTPAGTGPQGQLSGQKYLRDWL